MGAEGSKVRPGLCFSVMEGDRPPEAGCVAVAGRWGRVPQDSRQQSEGRTAALFTVS